MIDEASDHDGSSPALPGGPAGRALLGRSGVPVTRLGFGGAALGGLFRPVTADDAAEAVRAAWDAGVRYFDTAPHYGAGLSEERLGAALRGLPRREFTVSTKVGRLLADGPGDLPPGGDGTEFTGAPNRLRVRDYSRDGVLRSVEASLRRLGLDRVDVLYLHDPDEHWEQAAGEGFPALARLRDEGVVGAIGAGMNQTAMLARFIAETDLDVVLCAGRCSLLDGSAQRGLFPLCERRGVAVVAAGVFNSGVLADPDTDPRYDYARAPAPAVARARRLAAVCERHGVPLPAAALAWPARHPAVASVLVGMRSAEEVGTDVALAGTRIPPELWRDLETAGLLPGRSPSPGT
ncbi:aldo/keto reductase [Streptomyces hesseae]|uniref:Aldo/keto reductase n=1 Tax=Streptomyces hesseae TaxID=3075519 RepID=A0ABU2SF36_9ACTN|nr:aldo/keto reductase [Streptomyces sp. DSM 40473]MDT0447538.1 aldo/keto reductase [Streptomyces sp. DSM 40473]